MTDITAFAEAVKKMRAAQIEHSRTGNTNVLRQANKLAKDVDQMISQIIKPPVNPQNSLF